jgi:hypothetical protein
MSIELLWLVIALAAGVIAVSVAAIALALWRLAADARAATTRADGVLRMLDTELPPTLAALRASAAELDALAGESSARLVLLERLAEEGQDTMIAVRELSGSVNEILRGPADTVNGVRRSARMVGSGISSGADRLRRAIVGDDARPDGEP